MPKLQLEPRKPTIISVGGSLIVPNGGPDVEFLRSFKRLVDREVKKGRRFVLVTGGGKTARHYIDAADKVRGNHITADDLDWLGIHSCRLNAHLLRTILREVAHPVVIKDPRKAPKKWKGKVLIGTGWKPGHSSDYVAARHAKRFGSRRIINLSNIDAVFDVDPRKSKKAKPLEAIGWTEYRKMVGDDWHPGKSAPFDPVASRFCQRHGMQVAMLGGTDFKNIAAAMAGRRFRGTLMG